MADHTPSIEDSNDEWFRSILGTESSPSHTTKIPRVPVILKENTDHAKCYVPRVVSLGPYHHGKPNLQEVEGLKPLYANILLEGKNEWIRSLHSSLAEMVPMLRGYYEDDVGDM